MITILCANRVCIMVGDTSSMPQNYINCQKHHRFSGVLTAFCIQSSRGNKISQTAQTLGSHIYSTNVDIHRLWHDIPRFFDAFLRQIYIALETLKLQGLFTFRAPLMRNRKAVKLFFLFNHWLSIRSFGRRVKTLSVLKVLYLAAVCISLFCSGLEYFSVSF